MIPSLPGDDYCVVLGLNNHGEAVGTSNKNIRGDLIAEMPPEEDANAPHAFVYSNGKTIWLGIGNANAINDRGQIVGSSHGTAILWQNGVRKTLGEGEVAAINEHGLIVGTCDFNPRRTDKIRACSWKDGRQVILCHLPGDAYGVHNRGQIVGRVRTTHKNTFRQPPSPGATVQCAMEERLAPPTNNGGTREKLRLPRYRGQGVAFLLAVLIGSRPQATLWQQRREYDLNRCVRLPKGWILNDATRINDRGWIIGEGEVDTGTNSPSPAREFTFLLTPE